MYLVVTVVDCDAGVVSTHPRLNILLAIRHHSHFGESVPLVLQESPSCFPRDGDYVIMPLGVPYPLPIVQPL